MEGIDLRAIREASNVTQAELAARLGTTQQWVSKYERGDGLRRPRNVARVLDAIHAIRNERKAREAA